MSRHLGFAALVALALCACGSDAADREEFAGRDSAGIEVLENDAALWDDAARWRLADRPAVDIGAGLDGDPAQQFANVLGVHRLPGGAIAVLDNWAPGVVFFDTTGALLGRVGRQGTGPGELQPRAVSGSFTCGTDTVYVNTSSGIAAYVPPGEYVRTFRTASVTGVRACGTAGIIGWSRVSARRTEPGVYPDSVHLVTYGLNGEQHAVIDTLPVQLSDWQTGPHEGLGYGRARFSPTLQVAVKSDMIATGYPDRFEIHLRDTTGAVERVVRVAGLDRRVGSADVAAFESYVLNPWRGNEDERRRLESSLTAAEGMPMPAFADLKFDGEGNLWARAYDNLDAVAFYDYSRLSRNMERPTISAPRRWYVLRADGRYLGTVDVPPEFTVHEIGADWVLGVWRDPLDIQYVRVYPIIKP